MQVKLLKNTIIEGTHHFAGEVVHIGEELLAKLREMGFIDENVSQNPAELTPQKPEVSAVPPTPEEPKQPETPKEPETPAAPEAPVNPGNTPEQPAEQQPSEGQTSTTEAPKE